jgi:DNA-binding transcriptional regulator GbsR (MarR family)
VAEPNAGSKAQSNAESTAEQIRRTFAAAWGEIGAAWGVTPSTAAVQGYFLAHGGPLTEPEIRRALGLSHRAASLALADCQEWGLIHRSPEARRSGQRGPAAAAYEVVGDHWEWMRRVAKARKERETDPVLPLIERCVKLAQQGADRDAGDAELADLSDRLGDLLRFVRLFDRGVGLIVETDPRITAKLFKLLEELDDETILRLVGLADALSPDELAAALHALGRLSPRAVRRLIAVAGTPGLTRLIGSG